MSPTPLHRVDVPPELVPEALRARHVAAPVGAVLRVELPVELPAAQRGDVVAGAGFAVVGGRGRVLRLERLRSLPDTVGPGMRLLIVGLNPSEVAADAGLGFAGPTNRFWPAAAASGLVSEVRDPGRALAVDGVGMTDLVKRATPRSSLLAADEYAAGMARLDRLAAWLAPGALCFVGLEGWRAARDRRARPGWQPGGVGGRPAYVMPSTSGLNASARLSDLVDHLRAALAGPG